MPATSLAMHSSTESSGAVDESRGDNSHSVLCTNIDEFITKRRCGVRKTCHRNPVHTGAGSGPRRYGNCGTAKVPNLGIFLNPSSGYDDKYSTSFDIVSHQYDNVSTCT